MNQEANSGQQANLRVGCAMWANRAWVGPYLPASTRSGEELAAYATWCTTVEGNTTFYSSPAPTTVARWGELAPESFQFCFKLPKTVTHERKLRDCQVELTEFLALIAPLGPRVGPVQIQLPAAFAPDDLGVLGEFIAGLSADFDWAVEVRHDGFFAGGGAEAPLDDLLQRHNVNRVVLDSRALFAAPPVTPEELDAWENKPRVPVRPVAIGHKPLVRLIGQSDLLATRNIWAAWLPIVARWVASGLEPHVFTHTPDNKQAPELARWFWDEVAALMPPDIALTPLPAPAIDAEQLDLF